MHQEAVAGEAGGGLRVGAARAEEQLDVGAVVVRIGRDKPAAIGAGEKST